jgi:tRNA/rRNA methyltransferase
MLRCADGSYYVGHTDNLEGRVAAHQEGIVRGYTTNRRPVQLVSSDWFHSRDEGFACERQLKGWSRAKKEALVRGDWESLPALAQGLTNRNRPQASPAAADAPSASTRQQLVSALAV